MSTRSWYPHNCFLEGILKTVNNVYLWGEERGSAAYVSEKRVTIQAYYTFLYYLSFLKQFAGLPWWHSG